MRRRGTACDNPSRAADRMSKNTSIRPRKCALPSAATTIARLEAKIAELHGDVRRLATEKQLLATENLVLLQRARQAEDRLTSRDREAAELRRKSSRLTVVK